MAREILVAENFISENIKEVASIKSDAEASQAVVNVDNPDGVAVNDYVLVGNKGAEPTEIGLVQGVSGDAVTLTSNLAEKHYKGEQFLVLRFNQLKFYRAANVDGTEPDDDDFSLLNTLDIEGDQLYTEYVDTSGGSDYWYLYTFYNETTAQESSKADALKVRGGQYNRYVDVDSVRREAGLTNNRYISDAQILFEIENAESEVKAHLLMGGYTLPLTEVSPMVRKATQLLAAGYLLVTDYGPEFSGTNKDGERKIKEARMILKQIAEGDLIIVTGTGDTESSTSSDVRGYPDDTAENQDPSEDVLFKITKVF